MTTPKVALGFWDRMVRRVPILGFAIECIETDRLDRLAVLGITVLMALVLAVLIGGFPVFITILHAMVVLAALFILAAIKG